MSQEARTTPALPPNSLRAVLRVLGIRPAISRETDQPVLLVGSRRDCDVFVNDADVSKVHCAIVNTGDALMVADLSSRLGTYVNDQKVTCCALKPGDRLSIANVSIQVEWLAIPPNIYTKPEKFVLPQPLRLSGDGREHVIDAIPAVIGRRGTSSVPLDTPDVSLAHALIFTIDGRPVIADLESRSGTFVQHSRVRIAWLCNRDEVKVGGIPLRVEWSGPMGAEPSLPVGNGLPSSAGAMGNAIPVAPQGMGGAQVSIPGMTLAGAAMTAMPMVATLHAVNDAELESTIQDLRAFLDRLEGQLRARQSKIDEREKAVDALTKSLESMRVHFETQSAEFQTRMAAVEKRERDLSVNEVAINDAKSRLTQFQAALLETNRKLSTAPAQA
ncbi:MAG: FHA domain-containing protein [Phycisphaerae bacterium]